MTPYKTENFQIIFSKEKSPPLPTWSNKRKVLYLAFVLLAELQVAWAVSGFQMVWQMIWHFVYKYYPEELAMLRWQRIDITLVNHLLSYEFKEVHGKNCYSHPTTTAYVIQFKRISLESSREMGMLYTDISPAYVT